MIGKEQMHTVLFGGVDMAFIAGMIEALVKAAIVLVFAFCGIIFGKKMRDRKTAQQSDETKE